MVALLVTHGTAQPQVGGAGGRLGLLDGRFRFAAGLALTELPHRGLCLLRGFTVAQVAHGLLRFAGRVAVAQIADRFLRLAGRVAVPEVADGLLRPAAGFARPDVADRFLRLAGCLGAAQIPRIPAGLPATARPPGGAAAGSKRKSTSRSEP